MAVRFGFFNSVNGDRRYNADDVTQYFDKLISNGVVASSSDALQVMPGDGMTVNVQPGKAYIDGHWITNDSVLTLNIDPADVTKFRCDRIIIKLDNNTTARNMSIEVLKGGLLDGGFSPPTLPTDPLVKCLTLAWIYIEPNTTNFNAGSIADKRPDTIECGWVTGLINQVDTSTLYQQWEAKYEEQYQRMLDWNKSLEEGSISLNRVTNTETTTDGQTEVPVGITSYAEKGGILEVYINGVHLTPGTDYITSTDRTKITLTKPVTADNDILFSVIQLTAGK